MIEVDGRTFRAEQQIVEHMPTAGECVELRAYPPLTVRAGLPRPGLTLQGVCFRPGGRCFGTQILCALGLLNRPLT